MRHSSKTSLLALALLATTMLTPPDVAHAAPGDALGPEFQVNSFTTQSQSSPAIATGPDGDFVVVWSSMGQDGDLGGVFAQRFDDAGNAMGVEFQVNTTVTGGQAFPAVAIDADGNFIVVWASGGDQDGEGFGIFAQRYDALGNAVGVEFRVNTFTTGDQVQPAVAMDADGDFVVVWTDGTYGGAGQDGSGQGIFAQRYDAAGANQGDEFRVNSFTTGNQITPAVAMDAEGDFVVVWADYSGQDGSYGGTFAQRYDAAGAAQGSEFQVNTFTSGDQGFPSAAMDADGDFVVTWTDEYVYLGVFAQRYDAAGVTQGPEFQVNTFDTGFQGGSAVAMDADGEFVVVWADYGGGQDGSGAGVFAQRYDAAGVAQGTEFQVNTFTTGHQAKPAVAMDADGDFVVSWASLGQDNPSDTSYATGYGVFAQRYDGAARIEGDFDGDGNADLLWRNTATGDTYVWLMEGTERRAAQSIGIVPLVWQVAGSGDFNGDGKADILWRHTGNGNTVIWQMDGFTRVDWAAIGQPPLAWVIEQLRDTDGDGNSDIFWRNTGTGRTVVWRMSGFTRTVVGAPGGAGPSWEVR